MKRKLLAIILTIALVLSCTPLSYAAAKNSLSNFIKTRTYTDGTFTDIKGHWAEASIKRAYEYGIINGKGNNKFDPSGTMTGAEALAIAVRIHATYKYGGDPEAQIDSRAPASGGDWWAKYLEYGEKESSSVATWKMIAAKENDAYLTTPIQRKNMALMWAGLLDEKDMESENEFIGVPDVWKNTKNLTDLSEAHKNIVYDEVYEAIALFYKMGIVNGTNAQGDFEPNANINRAAAAVIFMRIVDKNERISGRLYDGYNEEIQYPIGSGSILAYGTWSFALGADGVLYGWGNNSDGILSPNGEAEILSPLSIASNVRDFGFFDDAGIVINGEVKIPPSRVGWYIKSDNTLWVWGKNGRGLLGDSDVRTSHIKILDNVESAALNLQHGIALKKDGGLYTWGGENSQGLGFDAKDTVRVPTKMLDNVISYSYENNYGMAIKNDGTLWAWGWNHEGRLGDGTVEDRTTPVKIMDNVKSVKTNNNGNTYALKKDGTLWAWSGYTIYIGGTTNTKRVPVKILDNVESVDSMAIKTDGSLWTIGLGENSKITKIMDNVVFANKSHAIKKDGTLWAWGSNYDGQLGDGTIEARAQPVYIANYVSSVSSSGDHTLILKADGTIWTCGSNSRGKLGNGSSANAISALPKKVIDGIILPGNTAPVKRSALPALESPNILQTA